MKKFWFCHLLGICLTVVVLFAYGEPVPIQMITPHPEPGQPMPPPTEPRRSDRVVNPDQGPGAIPLPAPQDPDLEDKKQKKDQPLKLPKDDVNGESTQKKQHGRWTWHPIPSSVKDAAARSNKVPTNSQALPHSHTNKAVQFERELEGILQAYFMYGPYYQGYLISRNKHAG